MHETHRFGAFISLCLASLLLLVSAAVEAGRDEVAVPYAVSQPALAVESVAVTPPVVAASRTRVLHTTQIVSSDASAATMSPAVAVGDTSLPSETITDTPKIAPTPTRVASSHAKVEPLQQVLPAVTLQTPPAVPESRTAEGTVATPGRSQGSSAAFLSALESLIHQLTNEERARAGVNPLAYDTTLAENARAYSVEMQTNNFISHENLKGCDMTCRFKADGYTAYYWGENLARWRSSYEPSLTEVAQYFVDEWKASDGHRDNLFSRDFTHEGIGAVINGNEVYVTVHFADPT